MNDCKDNEYDSDSDRVPFFADATLDIEEARGIASSPDNLHRLFTNEKEISIVKSKLRLPNVHDDEMIPSLSEDSTGRKNGELSMSDIDDVPKSSKRDFTVSAIYNDQMPFTSLLHTQNTRLKKTTKPRDRRWLCGFVISFLVLLLPFFLKSGSATDHHRLQVADFPLFLCLSLTILMSRLLYTSRGGSDGEDQRYLISQILIVSNPISCVLLLLLTLTVYYLNVGTKLYDVTLALLIGMTVRELYFFAKLYRSDSIFVEGVNDTERTFFRMMVNTSLDLISRTFGRKRLYRAVVFTLIAQFSSLFLLRKSLEYSYMCRYAEFWIFIIVVVGYWCVNVLIRFLGYIVCGGIIGWFIQRGKLMDDFERINQREEGNAYEIFELHDFDGDGDDFDDMEKYELRNQKDEIALTIERFAINGLRYSFGSIVRCALVGDLARFIWFFNLPTDDISVINERVNMGEAIDSWGKRARIILKDFARNNHDLGLCHVAAYHSSYTKGSNDVISLVDFSGEFFF